MSQPDFLRLAQDFYEEHQTMGSVGFLYRDEDGALSDYKHGRPDIMSSDEWVILYGQRCYALGLESQPEEGQE